MVTDRQRYRHYALAPMRHRGELSRPCPNSLSIPRCPSGLIRWRSPALGLEMPIVSYERRGQPILLFPTAAADFAENARFRLIKASEPLLRQGRVRVDGLQCAGAGGGLLGMSGFSDVSPSSFNGYTDDNCYVNRPRWYVANMDGVRSIRCGLIPGLRLWLDRERTKSPRRRGRSTICLTASRSDIPSTCGGTT